MVGVVFFFHLFHQLADDEAIIMFLQTSLFFVFPYVVDNCISFSSKSSLTLSIHLFCCPPLLLSPLICPCNVTFGIFFFHPFHVSKTCKSFSFNLLYHRFLRSKFFSRLLVSDSFSSTSSSDPSQPRHFYHQWSFLIFIPQCPALRTTRESKDRCIDCYFCLENIQLYNK